MSNSIVLRGCLFKGEQNLADYLFGNIIFIKTIEQSMCLKSLHK